MFAATSSLPLSAVGVSPEKYASASLSLLEEGLSEINKGKKIVKKLKLEPELIARETTGPVP